MLELKRALEIAWFSEPEYCLDSMRLLQKTSLLPIVTRSKLDAESLKALHLRIRETLKGFKDVSFVGIRHAGNVLSIDLFYKDAFTLEFKA